MKLSLLVLVLSGLALVHTVRADSTPTTLPSGTGVYPVEIRNHTTGLEINPFAPTIYRVLRSVAFITPRVFLVPFLRTYKLSKEPLTNMDFILYVDGQKKTVPSELCSKPFFSEIYSPTYSVWVGTQTVLICKTPDSFNDMPFVPVNLKPPYNEEVDYNIPLDASSILVSYRQSRNLNSYIEYALKPYVENAKPRYVGHTVACYPEAPNYQNDLEACRMLIRSRNVYLKRVGHDLSMTHDPRAMPPLFPEFGMYGGNTFFAIENAGSAQQKLLGFGDLWTPGAFHFHIFTDPCLIGWLMDSAQENHFSLPGFPTSKPACENDSSYRPKRQN